MSHEASFQLACSKERPGKPQGRGWLGTWAPACAPEGTKGNSANDCHPPALCPLQADSLAGPLQPLVLRKLCRNVSTLLRGSSALRHLGRPHGRFAGGDSFFPTQCLIQHWTKE